MVTQKTTRRPAASPKEAVIAAATPPRRSRAKPQPTPAAVPVPPAVAVPAAPAAPVVLKHKLVRDSFTMPEPDFALIGVLKATAVDLKRPAKKSELLRAGLRLLAQQTPAKLKAALDALDPIKTGRPKKG